MGGVNSAERLDIPLHAQANPVLATAYGNYALEFTSLCVHRNSVFGSDYKIIDARTKQHVFNFMSRTFHSRVTLQTPDGRVMTSIKSKSFSNGHRVYEGDEQDQMSLEIRTNGFSHPIIYADFQNRLSGQKCRVLLESSYERVVMLYIEFGRPNLPADPKWKDLMSSPGRFQAIGRIRRPHSEQCYVEAAPGVDLTLLLLLWKVWREMEERRERSRQVHATHDSTSHHSAHHTTHHTAHHSAHCG